MTINLTLPTCWQELTLSQMRYVFFLLSQNYSSDEVKTFCLCRFGGLEVLGREGNGYRIRYEHNTHLITALQIAEILPQLAWLDELPLVPVRLPYIGKHKAVNPDLTGVPFADYLACDNLYYGYLQTKNNDLLSQMAAILYGAQDIQLNDEESVSVFYWFASLKAYYKRRFRYLFADSAGDSGNLLGDGRTTAAKLQSAMDNQIRALTKGDVTKEKEVLATDTVRALTELNSLARDYEEMQKDLKK